MIALNKTFNILNPLLYHYFEGVQNTMKKIVIGEPYNIPKEDLDDFLSDFLLSSNLDKIAIKAIVEDCYHANHDYSVCANALLKNFYRKYKINNQTKQELTNKSYVIENKILKLSQFVNENENNTIERIYDGENGFLILLQLLSEHNILFYKPTDKRYLNTGDFNLFFYTNPLNSYHELLIDLKMKKSLLKTCNTVEFNIKTLNLSFYFSIANNELKYGLYDIVNHKMYTSGVFKTDSKFIKKLSNYNTCMLISTIINNLILSNITFLGKVKAEFKNYLKDNPIIFLNEKTIIKKINYSEFKNPYLAHDKFLAHFENWVLKFKWNSKVNYYIELDNENVIYYIRIKEMSEKPQ